MSKFVNIEFPLIKATVDATISKSGNNAGAKNTVVEHASASGAKGANGRVRGKAIEEEVVEQLSEIININGTSNATESFGNDLYAVNSTAREFVANEQIAQATTYVAEFSRASSPEQVLGHAMSQLPAASSGLGSVLGGLAGLGALAGGGGGSGGSGVAPAISIVSTPLNSTAPVTSIKTVAVEKNSSVITFDVVAGNDIIGSAEQNTTLSGTADINSTLILTLGIGNNHAVTVDSNGRWTYRLTHEDIVKMGVGSETLLAVSTDAAGNSTSAAHTVLVNTQAEQRTDTPGSGYGSDYIDSLVWGHAGWTGGAVTYSFAVDASNPAANWTYAEKNAMKAAMQLYSNVANIQFIEGVYYPVSTQMNDSTNIVLFKWTQAQMGLVDPEFSAFFEIPNGAHTTIAGTFNYEKTTWSNLNPGTSGFHLLVHELGHGLGLAHPHDGGSEPGANAFPGVKNPYDLGTNSLNQGIFSIMSYNDNWTVQPAITSSWGDVSGPMVFDIAAVQKIYGVNTVYNTGDNTYTLPSTNGTGAAWSCIWDAGGNDTISNAGSNMPSIINLNSIPISGGVNGNAYVSYVPGVIGGYTIAAGVTIENAVGGNGADILIGNTAANTLTCNGGGDKFVFNTALGNGNIDTITDFSVSEGGEEIWLDQSIFTALAGMSDLSNVFHIGTAAAKADDYLIYNDHTGALAYDADGSGAGAAVQFAILQNMALLTAADLRVI